MFADPGRMLGKYQLIAEIARGGMGVVYLAMVQGPGGFNKLVVVKELKPELVEEPAFLTMFLDEARLAARLSHPNIVQTNEVGNDGDRYFMAMDYLDGRGLDHVRRRSRTAGFGLSVPMQLRVICDVLAGLDYAHKLADFDGSPLHIVHRDVSPQNVFLTFDGQVKLLDFGIAKASDSMHETHAGVVKGKVSYMSPEQGRGQKTDARADVFSAGVLLWEALTGKRMREGKNEQEKLWALVSEDIPRASSIKPSIPSQLDDICAKAMAWNRDDRYPSAGAMQRDLERYLASTGTNVTARDVGACVSELFREDRVSTNAVIESHVARARGGTGREQLPIIDVARMGPAGHTPSNGRALTSGQVPAEHGGNPTSLDIPSVRQNHNTGIGHEGSAASVPRAVAPARNPRAILMPAAAGVIVVALGIFLFARSSHEAGGAPGTATPTTPPTTAVTTTPTPAPAASPVEPPPAPAKPTTIMVEIHASPDEAQIAIDDKPVIGNPFSGKYAIDEGAHHIRVTAPGHVARTRTVSFGNNVTLDIALEKTPAPSPPPQQQQASRPSRPQPPSRPSRPETRAEPSSRPADPTPSRPSDPPDDSKPAGGSDTAPTPGAKPRRPIDPNNPYGGVP